MIRCKKAAWSKPFRVWSAPLRRPALGEFLHLDYLDYLGSLRMLSVRAIGQKSNKSPAGAPVGDPLHSTGDPREH